MTGKAAEATPKDAEDNDEPVDDTFVGVVLVDPVGLLPGVPVDPVLLPLPVAPVDPVVMLLPEAPVEPAELLEAPVAPVGLLLPIPVDPVLELPDPPVAVDGIAVEVVVEGRELIVIVMIVILISIT